MPHASGVGSQPIAVPEDVGEVFTFLYRKGMTDGLPVIPPTPKRVEEMLTGSPLQPDHVIAELPPRGGIATVEKLAINAVMAGCLPEYFPVVIAAVEAMAQPQFNLLGIQTTTNPVASFLQPESILMMLSNAMTAYGANSYTKGCGNPVVILPPAHARIFADAGWTKKMIKEWLFEHTKFPLADMPAEPRLLDTTSRQQIEDGKLCICRKAEEIVVIVAGGPELNHVAFLANFGSDFAISRIRHQ